MLDVAKRCSSLILAVILACVGGRTEVGASEVHPGDRSHDSFSETAVQQLQAAPEDTARKQQDKSPQRSSPVQLYGQLRLSVDNYSADFGAGTGGAGGAGTTIRSNCSRFGVKGELPTTLGATRIIYQAEVLYGAAEGTRDEVEWREAYAGLVGDFGQARLGRLDVFYKATLTTIDPWNDTQGQSRGYGGRQGSSSLHSSYFTNAAEYVSPSVAGVKVGAWVTNQLDDETTSLHGASPITNFRGGSAVGIGAKFNRGGLFLGADLVDFSADSVSASVANGSGWQLGGRYKLGAASLGVMYEDVADLGLGENLYLVGSYSVAPIRTTFIASHGRNRDAAVYAQRDIDTWSMGAKYALNPDSELFTTFLDRAEDAFGTTEARHYRVFTVGINARFSSN